MNRPYISTKLVDIIGKLRKANELWCNNSIDHILDEMRKDNFGSVYGYKLDENLPAISILGFTDDTVLIGKNKDAAITLHDVILPLFEEIELKINNSKTKIINIEREKFKPGNFPLHEIAIQSVNHGEKIKNFGINCENEIVADTTEITSHLLKTLINLHQHHI